MRIFGKLWRSLRRTVKTADCCRMVRGFKEVYTLAKNDVIEATGKIMEKLPNAEFIVELENGHRIVAHISGKLRMNYIRIIPGDTVKIEMSPYDLTKGRITWRDK